MKWGIFLLLGVIVFASEGEESKEAIAEGNEEVAKDVVTEKADEDDHENEDDIGELNISSVIFDPLKW